MISKIRVSYGTGIVLGLIKAKQDVAPTTAYLLWDSGCIGSCSFCPRANGNSKTKKLSRILWPEFDFEEVYNRLVHEPRLFSRICLQTGYNPKTESMLEEVGLKLINTGIATSMTLSPGQPEFALKMLNAGLDHVGIGLDGATKSSYTNHKHRNWEKDWSSLKYLLQNAGGKIEVHLIYGLGDTEEEVCKTISSIITHGGKISLFALMPVNGGESPEIKSYRRIQVFRYLCENKRINFTDCTFTNNQLSFIKLKKDEFMNKIDSGAAFRTSGCGNCNRPYYNERPGHEFYNFPRRLTDDELKICINELDISFLDN